MSSPPQSHLGDGSADGLAELGGRARPLHRRESADGVFVGLGHGRGDAHRRGRGRRWPTRSLRIAPTRCTRESPVTALAGASFLTTRPVGCTPTKRLVTIADVADSCSATPSQRPRARTRRRHDTYVSGPCRAKRMLRQRRGPLSDPQAPGAGGSNCRHIGATVRTVETSVGPDPNRSRRRGSMSISSLLDMSGDPRMDCPAQQAPVH